MKALIAPTEPATTMSTPFIEIPQRVPASPSITTSPPWPVAAAAALAVPFTRTSPDMMFSATPTPHWPWITTVARWFMPAQ